MARKTNYSKNGNEYFRVTATIGRDSEGKIIRKEFYGKSKKEAEDKKDEYLNGIKSGLNTDFKNITLGELMHSWLFEVIRVSDKIKPSTFQRYEGVYRNYVKDSEIYGLKLDTLKSLQLQRYYNKLSEDGKSGSIIKNLNKLLKQFFNYAMDEGYLLKNPCSGKKITIPGWESMKTSNIETFTNEEIKLFSKTLKGHRLKTLFLLDFGTGLRQGELLGLKWHDIDLKKKELKVQRNIKQVVFIAADETRTYKTIEQVPKTKNSIRTVPIPTSLIPILKKHKSKKKEEKLKAGTAYINSDYVFTTELGTTIDARNLDREYKKLLKKAGIKYKKFHSIRHTFATKLFEKGVPLKTVSELLGHSDIAITANTYTHVIPKLKVTAVEKLNDLFI